MFYHAGQWSGAGLAIGAAGVDLFFVISGFVMGLALSDPDARPARFLRVRLWRIAPPYWIATGMVLILALAAPRLLPHVYPAAGHLVLSLLFIPHLDPAGLPFPVLPVGWSLSYEMVFYIAVAAALSQPSPRRLASLTWMLVAVMMFGVVVRPAYYLIANPMMLQFLAGALIARAHGRRDLPRHGAGLALIITGLAIFCALSRFDLYASLWRPLLWGAPAALIVVGAVSLEVQGAIPRLAWLERLGDASYSIYLCHWPIVVMLDRTLGARPAWLFVPAASAVAVAMGWLAWRYVERPLLSWGRRRIRDGRPDRRRAVRLDSLV